MSSKPPKGALPAWLIRPNVLADASRLIPLINAIAAENRWFVTEEFVQTPEWERVDDCRVCHSFTGAVLIAVFVHK